ncbi:MAG TPA: hypothetical protein VNJ51_13095 [Candidatus Dormibacteraeota bacterium]|nr:hypothetical protein [Candidatus Dormibacteraeota bacterium]
MQTELTIHYVWGVVVVVAAIWAIWQPLGRRVALWALLVQLVLGLWLLAVGKRVTWLHPALWLLAALLIQGGAIMAKRKPGPVPTLLIAIGAACAAFAFRLGQASAAGGS